MKEYIRNMREEIRNMREDGQEDFARIWCNIWAEARPREALIINLLKLLESYWDTSSNNQ